MARRDLNTRQQQRTHHKARAALIGGLALIGLLTLGVSEASAQGARRGQSRGAEQARMATLAEVLDLTPAQQRRIRAMRQATRRDLADERLQLRALRVQIERARSVSNPNERRVMRLYRQMSRVQAQIRQRQASFRTAVIRLLSPQQRLRLARLIRQQQNRTGRSGQLQLGPQRALFSDSSPAWNIRPFMPSDSPVNQ